MTGSVYGSNRVLNRSSELWSLVERVGYVGLLAELEALKV